MKEKQHICKTCLMPDNYPGITFNNAGICNFCSEYKHHHLLGEGNLYKKITSKKGEKYDCLLGLSGGKDSCYVAYVAKKKFGLRALAVCYDFPFLTDLARQNVQNVCSSLNIDLLIIKSKDNLENDLIRNHLISLAPTGTTWGQCMFCHYGIKAVLYNIAKEKNIPFTCPYQESSST